MAFTTPITWTTNQLVTAANLNEQIRDNSNAMWFQPAVRAFHSAAQSIASGVETALALNSERFDQFGGAGSTMHDLVTNNSRLTCRATGIYQITGTIEWANAATGVRDVRIRLNGTTDIAFQRQVNPTAGDGVVLTVSTIYALTVTVDYVELTAFQSSGAGLNVNATANYSPEFMMVRVG